MYDIVIKNGTIIDGTGKEKFLADVGIEGDSISYIGDLRGAAAKKEINAAGLFITPGFIDITNHSDLYWTLFSAPGQESMLCQGVTTIIGGVCGSSIAPLIHGNAISAIQKWSDPADRTINWLRMDEFLEHLSRRRIGVNFGTLVGHATLRRGIVGDEFRPLTNDELEKMRGALHSALEAGAFGMSTGLVYSHARHSTFEELIGLARIVKKIGGVYHTHLRNEAEDLLLAVNEAIRVGRESEIPVHIAHFKAMGENNWPLFKRAIEMVELAAEGGLNITFDVYPYTSTASVLYILLPDWVSEGGKTATINRLKDDSMRRHVIEDMKWSPYKYGSITIAQARDQAFTGRTVAEIAKNANVCVEEALINLIVASEDRVIAFVDTISKNNVSLAIKSRHSMISTAAAGYNMSFAKRGQLVHPRSFGTFPRALSQYTRKRELIPWEKAIAKMSSEPARFLGIKDRGIIARKYKADIAVIDPNNIEDTSTYENPYQFPNGIEYVVINGVLSVEKGKCISADSGAVLRRI